MQIKGWTGCEPFRGAEGVVVEESLNPSGFCDIDGGDVGGVGQYGGLALAWLSDNLRLHFSIRQVRYFEFSLPYFLLLFLFMLVKSISTIGQVWRIRPAGVKDEPSDHIADANFQSSSL